MSKPVNLKVDLLVIDPQNDFVDTPGKPGALAVAGAYDDCKRLSMFIDRVGHKLRDIHVTMDTHHLFDVAHPGWWKSPSTGKNPTPFTIISSKDIGSAWVPVVPTMETRMVDYVKALEASNRYPLCVWPPHCLIGSEGHNIQADVYGALRRWEEANVADVDYVTKGSNPFTEHYSAVQAEIPDPSDPTTSLNMRLINMLQECDQIIIAGEALSHCVANTVRDIANNFGEDNVRKMVLLEDCSSNVTGFEQFGKDFVSEMTKRGMQVVKSTEFMK